MNSLNVDAYSVLQTVTVNVHLLHIKTIISDTSRVNVSQRLPVPNISGFVIAQRHVFLRSFLRLPFANIGALSGGSYRLLSLSLSLPLPVSLPDPFSSPPTLSVKPLA